MPVPLEIQVDVLARMVGALLERLRLVDTLEWAHRWEVTVQQERERAAEDWEPQMQGGWEHMYFEFMNERLAELEMRQPGEKTPDPEWERRAGAWEMVVMMFRNEPDEPERIAHEAWRLIRKEPQAAPPPEHVLAAVVAVSAEHSKRRATALTYALWGVPEQAPEDFQKRIERILSRRRPHNF